MKKKGTHFHLLLAALFCCLLCSKQTYAQTPAARNGQLKVIGLNLCNQYGNPIQLRGMSSHGIQWYGWGNCLTAASLDALAYDWGADVFRISLYVQEGGYETNPTAYTTQVNRLIEEATSRGMYALVDWHILSPGDPHYNLERAKTFFTAIANTHKTKTNILYEICNEPNSGANWSRIKSYADQLIPVIRAIHPASVILVGTPGWSSLGLSGDGPLEDIFNNQLQFPNVLYTFHFYAQSHQAAYLNQLDRASNRLPMFVTEFGTQNYSGEGDNDFAMSQQYIDLMRRKKISWVNWNYSSDWRSGAVWTTGTCPNGPWTTARLKPAGLWVRERMLSPADDFPVTVAAALEEEKKAEDSKETLSQKIDLSTYPNPFNDNSTISLSLSKSTTVVLAVYNFSGKLVTTLKSGKLDAGRHTFTLSGKNLPQGIYNVKLTYGEKAITKKIVKQ
jgi:endoglucanase